MQKINENLNFLMLYCMPLVQCISHTSPWRNLSFLLTDSDKIGFTATEEASEIKSSCTLELEDSIGLLQECLQSIATSNTTKYESDDQMYDILEAIKIHKEKMRHNFVFRLCSQQHH